MNLGYSARDAQSRLGPSSALTSAFLLPPPAQSSARAQADLSSRRKEFHGVVTYMFDGIFSWQMYGSADAVDEDGSPYTVRGIRTVS